MLLKMRWHRFLKGPSSVLRHDAIHFVGSILLLGLRQFAWWEKVSSSRWEG